MSSDEPVIGGIEVDKSNLYREETFSDLRVASIRRLTPVRALEDITVIGGQKAWFDAEPERKPIETLRIIMKDGVIYKNTL